MKNKCRLGAIDEPVRPKSMSSSVTTSLCCQSRGRKVGFDRVVIDEHAYTLGDNPSVSDGGAPLTIVWKSQQRMVFMIDDYEQIYRKISDHPSKKVLRLSVSERARL
jgi:hypothetical protein